MLIFLLLVVVGIVVATFGSLVGLGGGVIMVPALIYWGPEWLGREITTAVAVGTSLVVLLITATSSTITYTRQKKVDFRSGWLYAATSGPAAIMGSILTGGFKPATFEIVFGFFMLIMAFLMVYRDYAKPSQIRWKIRREFTDEKGNTFIYGYNILAALAVGCAVGIVSGLFGIGGGALFVPVMVLLFAYPPHLATATSMFVIVISSFLGAGTHALLGHVDWWSAAALAPGAWIGGKLGARIALRMSGKGLLWLLRITLLLLAVRMIVSGFSA